MENKLNKIKWEKQPPPLSSETALQIALHINKSNLDHIDFLEKRLVEELKYINNLTHITCIEDIREYTEKMIKELK